jgi:hypothetical protein
VSAETPDAAELLRLARETLLAELLAALPEDKRYAARLVANAMAIAAREIEGGTAAQQAALEALCRLYGVPREGAHLDELSRRLARDIRAGAFDGDERVPALLLADIRARLAISNPKALPDVASEKPSPAGPTGRG